ncbi:MAG: polyamine aminopropyltransferase [Bacteroidales bacterium]|jgi:spermidine synthase|nr:polyamine aminopropyltransferase [Bacteroidales bacterium]
MSLKSNILKLSIFATGLSGIVAQYILSTLASYFLGDSTVQWALTVSIMLFAMGLGARVSKYLTNNLLSKFIFLEFLLSVFVSFSSLFVYLFASYSVYLGILIYSLTIIIGFLIGLEIPIVIRLNDKFENIRVNISTVLEKDYYGSLIGGVLFAFVGLPYLGLTYTPFVLGLVNFSVALLLFFMLYRESKEKLRKAILSSAGFIVIAMVFGASYASPIILFGEQKRYKEKVVYAEQSKYQRIVITQWKDDYYLFLNGNKQLSTVDEEMYHEPLVHPVMKLAKEHSNVLILGGGDGCAIREVLKHDGVENITLVDLDPAVTELAKESEILLGINKRSLFDERVKVVNTDGLIFMENSDDYYDVIIIDLPDPRTIELSKLYSLEFYNLCRHRLKQNGFIITQSGSPYYAARAFKIIHKTMSKAGFGTLPIHNQVLSFGEWGWMIGAKNMTDERLKQEFRDIKFNGIKTKWINEESLYLLSSFGKDIFDSDTTEVIVNKISNPILYRYYLGGKWDLY